MNIFKVFYEFLNVFLYQFYINYPIDIISFIHFFSRFSNFLEPRMHSITHISRILRTTFSFELFDMCMTSWEISAEFSYFIYQFCENYFPREFISKV